MLSRRLLRHRWLALLIAASLAPANAIAAEAPAGLLRDQTMVVDDLTRTYDLYIPRDLGSAPRPVVLLLHGHSGDADVMTGQNRKKAPYKIWLEIAEREKLILIIPDGERGSDGHRGWNDCRRDAATNPTTDDMAFLGKLLDSVAAKYPVDARRLYATGTSNGGNMVFRLALETPDRFAAVAPVVASMPKHSECETKPNPVSILIMNGTQDPLLPYAGGPVGKRESDHAKRGEVLSTRESVAYWVRHNGADPKVATRTLPDRDTEDGSTVHVEHYRGGRNGTEVALYEVRGGGHTEPSVREQYRWLYRRIVGPQNHDIEMAEEVWAFFRDKHR
jgi:polyhydroxybutyrate depolymerase